MRFHKKCNLFECQCILIYHESNWVHYFYWRRDRQFPWLFEPCEGPAANRAKAVLSFLGYFKFWSGPGNRTRDLPLCIQVLYQLSQSCGGHYALKPVCFKLDTIESLTETCNVFILLSPWTCNVIGGSRGRARGKALPPSQPYF